MALILSLETSTRVCSVALHNNGELIAYRESFDEKSHATQLTVFVEEIFAEHQISAIEIDAVCVSKGPGSYTGLRIGVSVAKGICYGANKPLLALNTLEILTQSGKKELPGDAQALLCPMIDARRMEVYTALWTAQGKELRPTTAEIIDEHFLEQELIENEIYFFGDGANKCKEIILHEHAKFIEDLYPSAKYMGQLATELYKNKKYEDAAYFEPYYLKNFVATISKKNLLQ